MTQPTAVEFGPFRLDLSRRELLAHGVPVTLGQRALDVLAALVRRRGGLVSKDELMAEVWPRVVVEENNLQVQVSALRKIFQAEGGGERYLVTVPGRGYRFVAPIHAPSPDAVIASEAKQSPPRPSAATNLPEPLTPLIARDAEVETIRERLSTHRLVTLTGAGGVGKTRLAIAAGKAVAADFSDGVRFVELAPVGDRPLVLARIAEVLRAGVADAATALDDLSAGLKDRQLLLVLDNCEHVLEEASRIAEALLLACPRLTILASSRERLGLAGETVFRVPSLAAPEPDTALGAGRARGFAAVRLFETRAAALGTGLVLTDANAGLVGAICRRLDGIPLAIELAVARLKILSLAQLARGLDDRLRLLTTGARTALPRHQTLEALIDWSYQPLAPAEKLFLQRFAVFAGAASLDSVEAVIAHDGIASDALIDLLASLVEKSLIVADAGDGEPRYRMLESVRLFARARLTPSDEAELRGRHARHFAARLAEASEAWETTAASAWGAAHAGDIDNVRAALDWAFGPAGDLAAGLALVGRTHVLWSELGLMLEHRHWVEEALRRCTPKTPAEVLARLLAWQAGDVRDLDDPADCEDALRAGKIFHKLGDAFAEGRMLLRAGTARLDPDGGGGDAERMLRRARTLLETRGKTKSLARCLSALATARLFAGDPVAARELHAAAVAIYRDLGELAGGADFAAA
jgi:predicted ATPase/DNA-binding winged helix-turn-helix (wHTH) protein